ncbi:glycoside hydrolase family 32 protein [Paenibacillus sp.]|uniref:glycoside hydrolase family 32 protein n=1 Tax=Paenibacillus sp. TaxID=58172 RepID=UPI002D516A70|nr:glycoside hydrolase family 32 protein [Paenibacillus sp.]HZG85813.1 glycoside hydrolase family 32 protein [Paenibacillus sp.]
MQKETLYRERYRPQFHLTPPSGALSDPNGMVYFDGEYHQFYQFTGRWGHAISRDLLHWEHRPLALVGDELGDVWSGSAVVDWRDTSGLFGGESGLVAIFTLYDQGLQSQGIAYSRDRGRTWTKYAGNPVLPNPGLKDFRDPKVFWHESSAAWVMVVSADRVVRFYRSPDLIRWTYASEFGEGCGSRAAVWECPDLFPLAVEGGEGAVKWVLHVSIGDNEETGGSTAQYFIGSFDGFRFVGELPANETRWTDYGQDFYAAVSYSDVPAIDGRRIWTGWMSNWRYPFSAPTEPWRGALSVPRSLSLAKEAEALHLIQRPVDELKRLRTEAFEAEALPVCDRTVAVGFRGTSFEFELAIDCGDAEEVGIRLCVSGAEETVIGYDAARREWFLDRSRSGFTGVEGRNGQPANFARRMFAPRIRSSRRLTLRGYVDASSVEAFADDGLQTFTALIYPSPDSDGVELYAKGGTAVVEYLRLYRLRSVWHDDD